MILRTQSRPNRRVTLLSFSESGVRSFMKNRELTLARIRRIIERFGYEDAAHAAFAAAPSDADL